MNFQKCFVLIYSSERDPYQNEELVRCNCFRLSNKPRFSNPPPNHIAADYRISRNMATYMKLPLGELRSMQDAEVAHKLIKADFTNSSHQDCVLIPTNEYANLKQQAANAEARANKLWADSLGEVFKMAGLLEMVPHLKSNISTLSELESASQNEKDGKKHH